MIDILGLDFPPQAMLMQVCYRPGSIAKVNEIFMTLQETNPWLSTLSFPMGINTAIQEVLKVGLIHQGQVHGLYESAKALDECQASLCSGCQL